MEIIVSLLRGRVTTAASLRFGRKKSYIPTNTRVFDKQKVIEEGKKHRELAYEKDIRTLPACMTFQVPLRSL